MYLCGNDPASISYTEVDLDATGNFASTHDEFMKLNEIYVVQ